MAASPAVAANSNPIDDGAVMAGWTPNRVGRNMRVVSLEDGNIRGGHWLLNQDGRGMTIAFLWKNSSGGIYGLTTGHAFALGDPVFVFLHSEPMLTEESDTECYEIMEIGEVVSKDIFTDSIVFEVTNCDKLQDKKKVPIKDRFDLLKLTPKSGLGERELILPRPNLNPPPPIDDSEVLIYGAMTRGNCCTVSTPRNGGDEAWLLNQRAAEEAGSSSDESSHNNADESSHNNADESSHNNPDESSHKNSDGSSHGDEAVGGGDEDLECSIEDEIGFELKSGQATKATQDGDCGALYLDILTGAPIAMHHAITRFAFPETEEPDEFESYGFPLSLIMARHPEQFDAQMFGTIEPAAIRGSEQEGTINTPVRQPVASSHRRHQGAQLTTSFQIQKFPVTIPINPVIPAKPATGKRKAANSAMTSSHNHDRKADREARKRARKACVTSRQIQQFNVTVGTLGSQS